jgi:ABC-2 type transport system ATP-binding protein
MATPAEATRAETSTNVPSKSAVEVRNLVKRYGRFTAVDSISFAIPRGEIFGMLGPNGAGKTTTLEILEGIRTADGG